MTRKPPSIAFDLPVSVDFASHRGEPVFAIDLPYARTVVNRYFATSPLGPAIVPTIDINGDGGLVPSALFYGRLHVNRIGQVLDAAGGYIVASFVEFWSPEDSRFSAFAYQKGVESYEVDLGRLVDFADLDGARFNDFLVAGAAIHGSDAADRMRFTDLAEHIFGEWGRDRLFGRGGDDWMAGGADRDTLTGGAGRDRFLFDDPLDGYWAGDHFISRGFALDRITDFSTDDTLALDHHVFRNVPGRGNDGLGRIAGDAFRNGAAAADAEDRILYDAATGRLAYDRDGTRGHYDPEPFARLDHHPALTAADFLLV